MINQARRWKCGRPISLANNAAFAVIREAMRGKDMVALGRVVISNCEHVIALEPYENGSWDDAAL